MALRWKRCLLEPGTSGGGLWCAGWLCAPDLEEFRDPLHAKWAPAHARVNHIVEKECVCVFGWGVNCKTMGPLSPLRIKSLLIVQPFRCAMLGSLSWMRVGSEGWCGIKVRRLLVAACITKPFEFKMSVHSCQRSCSLSSYGEKVLNLRSCVTSHHVTQSWPIRILLENVA